MGLHKFRPLPSGRMGTLWTLSSVRGAALLEFGSMGHMLYGRVALERAGVHDACKLYSTHIDEADISLGGTGRLSRAVEDIVRRDGPRVIFLLPSALPEMIGTDLPALCEDLQREYPDVRLLPFGYGGFNIVQHRGVQEALLLLARTLPKDDTGPTSRPTFNLIGSCADLFRFGPDAGEVVRMLEGAFGIKPLCIMTSDTSVEEIENMGSAHVNLVLRREGLPAAQHLQKRFGTPYVYGRPYGIEGTCEWLSRVQKASNLEMDESFVSRQREEVRRSVMSAVPMLRHLGVRYPRKARLSLGGHADVVEGILSFACGELQLSKGVAWCDCPDMADGNIPYFTEEQWTKAVAEEKEGLLMASGEALSWAGRSSEMQIANPDREWRINPYEPPFVGFRGAMHLASLLLNRALKDG